MAGGSGRGKKEVAVLDDPNRPDCPDCGGWMKSGGKKDWRCTNCGRRLKKEKNIKNINNSNFENILGFDAKKAEDHARKCEKKKRLIVTSAQNNTEVNNKFFQSLKQAAKHYNCEIAVIPSHYKNITLFTKAEEYQKEWAKSVRPYLVYTDINFGRYVIRSDVKINATTLWPLAGKQAHGGENSVIFGHPQIAMEPVATPANLFPKRTWTTGSVTEPNYTMTDAGEKARFHHASGALILEKCKDDVFVRVLNADERGHFYDLDNKFTPRGTTSNHKILSLTTGDEHEMYNTVKKETYFNKKSIVKSLSPKYIVRHDILDGYSGSHHHKSPMTHFKKFVDGTDDYRKEIDSVVEFLEKSTPKNAINLIVPSNHHDHLMQFLDKADANKDHRNALFILEMNTAMREAVLRGEDYDPFTLYLRDRLKCNYEILDRNQRFLIADVDHSQHGDVGTNGSRGSARGLAKSTYKMTIGHSHSARICQGVYQVGTSTGRLEYERGLSDHSNTHVIQYPNGKRTPIDIINGKWRS